MPIFHKNYLPRLATAVYGEPTETDTIHDKLGKLCIQFNQLIDEASIGLSDIQRVALKSEVSRWFNSRTLNENDRDQGLSVSLVGAFFVRFPKKQSADKVRYKQCLTELKRSINLAKNPFGKLYANIPLEYFAGESQQDVQAIMRSLEKNEKIFGNGKRAQYKNIDTWAEESFIPLEQVLNLRSNAKVVPFLRRYLHVSTDQGHHARKILSLLEWLEVVKRAKDRKETLTAQSTGRGVSFDSNLNIRILLNSRGSYSADSLNRLAENLSGLYVLYKKRFGVPNFEQPEIAQEMVLFHGNPTREGAETLAPSYVNWYLRRDGTVSEFHGVAAPGRKTVHVLGVDETFENRMRFLNINSEVDEHSSKIEGGNIHSRARGGIMLSESQEVRSEWSVSAKFVLIRLGYQPIKLTDNYSALRPKIREFAEWACRFVQPSEINHPSQQLILDHVKNSPSGSSDGKGVKAYNYFGDSLVSNQLEINNIARQTPKNWQL